MQISLNTKFVRKYLTMDVVERIIKFVPTTQTESNNETVN